LNSISYDSYSRLKDSYNADNILYKPET